VLVGVKINVMKRVKVKGSGTELISSNLMGGEFDFYDDCPICRMMKKAEEKGGQPTEKEVKKAFKEAEKERKKSLN